MDATERIVKACNALALDGRVRGKMEVMLPHDKAIAEACMDWYLPARESTPKHILSLWYNRIASISGAHLIPMLTPIGCIRRAAVTQIVLAPYDPDLLYCHCLEFYTVNRDGRRGEDE